MLMLAADSVTQIINQIELHNRLHWQWQDVWDNIDSMAALNQYSNNLDADSICDRTPYLD
jgi:hypothetical protein